VHDENRQGKGVSRRSLLKGAAATSLALTAGCGGSDGGSEPDFRPPATPPPDTPVEGKNSIEIENAETGTQAWRLTNTSTVPGKVNGIITSGRSPAIEGYCSANSVRTGERLKIMVSTNPASAFKLEIFRTGYYNGDGGRLMRTFDALPGFTQLDPTIGEGYLRECHWDPSVEFDIPDDWLSGVYLGKLTTESSGLQSYIIFIVRDDRPCDLLFQCSELTWSAYNRWPADYAIYTRHTEDWSNTGVPSGTVSFDRPYSLFTHPVNKMTNSGGSGEFLPWEFPLSFWLEQHGYDVSYISNIDTHSDRAGLLRAKGFISVGHDEYWTQDMFDNVLNARNEGVSLAFLCGNSALCKVPLLNSTDGRPQRTIRREGWFLPVADGQQVPPSLLNEEGFEPNMGPDGALLMGARHPIRQGRSGLGQGVGDWTCTAPEHWLYADTGMQAGDSIEGLVGWEFHGDPLLDIPGIQIVAEGPANKNNGQQNGTYTATIYDDPQGNIVFNAASIWWVNGLSSPPGHVHPSYWGATLGGPDERLQQIAHNLFQRIIKRSSEV
jgi:hypothetical protein|tara:strand:- start:744 stop:2393 length:1650 start_codon:yes stop_codon:yes gene_type:complete